MCVQNSIENWISLRVEEPHVQQNRTGRQTADRVKYHSDHQIVRVEPHKELNSTGRQTADGQDREVDTIGTIYLSLTWRLQVCCRPLPPRGKVTWRVHGRRFGVFFPPSLLLFSFPFLPNPQPSEAVRRLPRCGNDLNDALQESTPSWSSEVKFAFCIQQDVRSPPAPPPRIPQASD